MKKIIILLNENISQTLSYLASNHTYTAQAMQGLIIIPHRHNYLSGVKYMALALQGLNIASHS